MACKLGFRGEDRLIESAALHDTAKALARRIKRDEETRTGRQGPPEIVVHLPLDLENGVPLLEYKALQCQGHYYEDHSSMFLQHSCANCIYQK